MDMESPDGSTKNELDFVITDKKEIVQDETVLNRFSAGSDSRIVRAKIVMEIFSRLPRVRFEPGTA